ncbi:hypothetical protein OB13_16340 [Pontibacter sp. HJ8]
MRTKLDYSSLGEAKSNYSSNKGNYSSTKGMDSSTNSSVRQIKDKLTSTGSRQESGSAGTIALGLLAGAGMGVLAGILIAPDKGKTTRRRVADSASWVGRGITEAFGSKSKMGSWVGKGDSKQEDSTIDNMIQDARYKDRKW